MQSPVHPETPRGPHHQSISDIQPGRMTKQEKGPFEEGQPTALSCDLNDMTHDYGGETQNERQVFSRLGFYPEDMGSPEPRHRRESMPLHCLEFGPRQSPESEPRPLECPQSKPRDCRESELGHSPEPRDYLESEVLHRPDSKPQYVKHQLSQVSAPEDVILQEYTTLKQLVLLFVAGLVLWLPHYITSVVLTSRPDLDLAFPTLLWIHLIGKVSTCVKPLLYLVISDQVFRASALASLRCSDEWERLRG